MAAGLVCRRTDHIDLQDDKTPISLGERRLIFAVSPKSGNRPGRATEAVLQRNKPALLLLDLRGKEGHDLLIQVKTNPRMF